MIQIAITIRGNGEKEQQDFYKYLDECIQKYPRMTVSHTLNKTEQKNPLPHWLYTKSYLLFNEKK